MVVNNSEFIKNKSRINDLLEQLRKKLTSFEVISLRGQNLGRIRDFVLDKSRRLYMVIPQSDTQTDSPVYLLSSKYIQNVDASNRAIFVDINLTDFHQLPLYHHSKDKTPEFSQSSTRVAPTQASVTSSTDIENIPKSQPPKDESFSAKNLAEGSNQDLTEADNRPEVVEEQTIPLLEERLLVNRSKWKVGEVVVRKEIENQVVQVPIRREKLIIEQVSPEHKQIAEIDLGKGEVSGVEPRKVSSSDTPYSVTGEFLSPKAASHLLEAIALQRQHGCAKVRVELVLDNPELQETYQKMFDRCSKR